MQFELSGSEGLERRLTIALPAAEVDAKVDERLRKTASGMKLNGFRKGKVPMRLVKQRFGPGIRQEVLAELMNASCSEAIQQEGLRLAGPPKLELTELAEGKDVRFAAVFELYPEIELPDFSRIKLEVLGAEVTDEDVDTMIETLRRQRQSWEPVERAAAADDLVDVEYTAQIDGEAFGAGTGENPNLLLGSRIMLPGFEEALEGRLAGEEIQCKLQLPDEFPDEAVAGKHVDFEIRLKAVKQAVLPTVDEEFYQSFGIEDGGEEEFRAEIVRNMERELKSAQRSRNKRKITDAVVKRANLTVPESMLEAEIERMRVHARETLPNAPSEIPSDVFRDQARRLVVMRLVVAEIIETQSLKADAVRVREKINELASTYENPEEVVRWYYGNAEQLAAVESSVLEEQVFDYISDQAKVTEKSVSYQEAIRG